MDEVLADSPAGKRQGRGLPIRITWTGVLTSIQCLMLGAFVWGNWLVWTGLVGAVWALQLFAGATALLWLGNVLPALRSSELFRASVERIEDGEFAAPRIVRYRQRAVALVGFASVTVGAICAFKMLGHHVVGGVPLTSFDRWMLICGAFGLAMLVVARKSDIISKPQFMFLWAVGWRTVPILVTAIIPVLIALDLYSTDDPQMPLRAAIGMMVIAGQTCLLLLVERIDCGIQLKKHPGHPKHLDRRIRAKWGLVGEGLNLLACTVLVLGIWGATMMH